MKKLVNKLLWLLLGLAGASAYVTLALHRGEQINSAYILTAALCSYAIGYRFYSKWIAARVLALDDRRATPCEAHDDGRDFVKTNKWIVFGHHFAAIAGPGPLVGPVLAAQFGYLPGTLWILIGVVLGGTVQDFVILFCSMRRDGKSLGQMVKEELNSSVGFIAVMAILAHYGDSAGGARPRCCQGACRKSVGRFHRGRDHSHRAVDGLLHALRACRKGSGSLGLRRYAAAAGGVGRKLVYENPHWSQVFGLRDLTVAWVIIGYGVISSACRCGCCSRRAIT